MTAVNLTKLNQQIYELLESFTLPGVFHQGVQQLFQFYSVQVFRSGKVAKSSAGQKSYHLPPLILMQVERQLRKRCQENPQAALRLFDELMADPYQEISQLAASILGSIPVSHSQEVLQRILEQGIQWQTNEQLYPFLQRGSRTILQEDAAAWLTFLEEHLLTAAEHYPHLGLLLLQVSIEHEAFVNIPFFFRQFLLYFPNANPRYRQEYLAIFSALYEKVPAESLHFFEQSLILHKNATLIRIFRRFIPQLPEEQRSRFRDLTND